MKSVGMIKPFLDSYKSVHKVHAKAGERIKTKKLLDDQNEYRAILGNKLYYFSFQAIEVRHHAIMNNKINNE